MERERGREGERAAERTSGIRGSRGVLNPLVALFYPISEVALLGLARYHFEAVRLPAEAAVSPRYPTRPCDVTVLGCDVA
eukprot:2090599-Rhodomonas_salina.3